MRNQKTLFDSNNKLRMYLFALSMCLLISCNEAETGSEIGSGMTRWYTPEHVQYGAAIFRQNCAQCHGQQAEGSIADWRSKLEDGSLPPPPLNGTAHAWHHPRSVLLQVIDNGGVEYGGKMPGFAALLDDEEKLAAIAYFQSFWTDEIYSQWMQMGGTN